MDFDAASSDDEGDSHHLLDKNSFVSLTANISDSTDNLGDACDNPEVPVNNI